MSKKEKLLELMKKRKLDALLITDGYNMHYLTGYRGHTGCLFVCTDSFVILTDSRYTEQVTKEAADFECMDIGKLGYSKTLLKLANGRKLERLGFENQSISYSEYKSYKDAFGDECEFVGLDSTIDEFREIKTDWEIENIAMAEKIGDMAFEHILNIAEAGMTEREVALELEVFMRKNGASGISFDTIAASGENSSMPHAVPTERVLRDGDFLTMDFGCVYNGYCSDMTRTIFIGESITAKHIEVYNTVLKAQTESMKLIRPGVKCSDVDAYARRIIADNGYGDYFGHGLGHSVGLYIHEEPRLSPKCDRLLQEGMLMTVEPGIYIPGEFGVRIEDLVVVTKDGFRNLTNSPKVLIYG